MIQKELPYQYDADSFADRIIILLNTGLFGKEIDLELYLQGTRFHYDTIDCKWYKECIIGYKRVSFEEVFEEVEPELQTKLLFHLDLFR